MSKIITVDVNSELWKQGAREWELLKGKQALFNFLTCKTFNNVVYYYYKNLNNVICL